MRPLLNKVMWRSVLHGHVQSVKWRAKLIVQLFLSPGSFTRLLSCDAQATRETDCGGSMVQARPATVREAARTVNSSDRVVQTRSARFSEA